MMAPALVKYMPWVFVFLWSTGFVGAKYGLPYAEPFTLLLVRMSLTVVVFVMLILIFNSKRLTSIQALHQMIVGAFIHVGYLGSVFAAIKLGMPAGIAAIIIGLQPIITALLALVWLKEQLISRQWIGLIAGFIGVIIVLVGGQNSGDFDITIAALSFSIISVISISVGTLYQKKFGQGVDLISGSFYQYLMTAFLLAIIAFTFETGEIQWTSQFVLAITWMVFALSVAAVLLLMYLIKLGAAAKVASYFYMVPVFAVVEAWILFGEKLSIISILGMLLTVVGVYLVTKRIKILKPVS